MADAVDHGKVVLGAIFAYRHTPLLDYALTKLTPECFTDPVQANLFGMAELHQDRTQVILTRQTLEDGLRGQAPGVALKYGEYFDSLVAAAPPNNQEGYGAFLHSIDQLRELYAERATGGAIAQAMQILRQSYTEGRTEYRGHGDARTWLARRLSEIERELHQEDSPEGLMQHEGREIIDTYQRRKQALASGRTDTVATGIADLDKVLGGGFERGELDIVAGWNSSGKTSMVVQLAWHASVMQGKFVVLFTSETLRPQVRIKILARHSRMEKFGLPHGLNSADIKAGRLTPQGEQVLSMVTSDFTRSPGGIYIAQVPKGATVDVIASRLDRISRSRVADLCIIDYLQLLTAGTRRRAQWEEASAMVKEAKHMATEYRNGLGIPVISPWQVSREGRRAARERGFYIRGDLAETAEIDNSSDIILSLLEPAEYFGGRSVLLTLSVLKNRDGEAKFGDGSLTVDADYATCYFRPRSGTTQHALLDLSSGDAPFGG